MEKDKNELISIVQGIQNPKLVNYILNLIKSFLELRS